MNLLQEIRKVHPDACFVCRWTGKHVVIWPQNFIFTHNSPQQVSWSVYVNVHDTSQLRSGYKDIYVCTHHHKILWLDWQGIAQEEVNLDYIWNQWIDRIES